ncbi:MAG: hypothetical protein ABI263_01995 [Gelidibacter sp.]
MNKQLLFSAMVLIGLTSMATTKTNFQDDYYYYKQATSVKKQMKLKV